MKLPNRIEQAIQKVESYLGGQSGLRAGVPRLRELRAAIEDHLREQRFPEGNRSVAEISPEGETPS